MTQAQCPEVSSKVKLGQCAKSTGLSSKRGIHPSRRFCFFAPSFPSGVVPAGCTGSCRQISEDPEAT
ncbi:uncharacterized protein LOC119166798 isoform X3 [Rhipicephalus microplus]|uniref:uncharacterized protein LOC119166798 isoform X3 n=1 Tax=Rhipicephalus microplus TaxID=6941 RepID=UPI003F6D9CC8